MDTNQKVLIELLSLSLRGKKASYELMNSANLEVVLKLAQLHSVLPLVYTAIDHECIEKKLLADLKTYVYKIVAQQIQNFSVLERVIDEFINAGIPVLAMKGLTLRNLYPVPEARTMSDFDLAVRGQDFEYAIQILLKMGFANVGLSDIVHVEMAYGKSMILELHRQLFDEDRIKLPQNYLDELWENAIPVSVCGRNVLGYSDDDNLLYLCLHLAKHFEEGGFGLRQLCDIVLFVEAKYSSIKWEKFYTKERQLHISRFVSVLFALCHLFFNMDIPELFLLELDIKDEMLERIILDIVEGGIFGHSSSVRSTGTRILNRVGFHNLSKFAGLIRFLFPSPDMLCEKYSYIKKHSVLFPVAWVHRWFYNITDIEQRNMMKVLLKKETAQDSFYILKSRRELVNWLKNEE